MRVINHQCGWCGTVTPHECVSTGAASLDPDALIPTYDALVELRERGRSYTETVHQS